MVALATALAACSGDEGGSAADGGLDAPSGGCTSDGECDDGLFCNGAERCAPAEDGADAMGCVAASDPCGTDEDCDEDEDRCVVRDCATPDADMDGFAAAACGGDDCDDDDPSRFPGNVEVCDAEGLDEDCDPSTLGPDGDGDGFESTECCNVQDDGELLCGEDCDDARAGANPGAPDGCGGGDQDCDGTIDEEPDAVFYRDQDNDTYGVDDDTVMACSLPSGYAARGGDCADDPFEDARANERNPGESEICNEIDDDCDGGVDEGLSCDCTTPGAERDCGFDPSLDGIGICRLGTQMCQTSGMWTTCAGATPPTTEACNLDDDDCDGTVDEGVRITCWQDQDRDGYAPSTASTMDTCSCPDGWTDNDPSTGGVDCDDTDATKHPGATEVCDRIDSNCSRGGGDEPSEDFDDDGHTRTGYTGCTGGFDKDDCHDRNANVRPSQFRYFGEGYCRSGTCGCVDGTCEEPDLLGRCPFNCTGGSAPVSFDYDCDGVARRQPSTSIVDCACTLGEACPDGGPNYSGSPSCGSTVTIVSCGTGGCGDSSCTGSTSSGPMPCR